MKSVEGQYVFIKRDKFNSYLVLFDACVALKERVQLDLIKEEKIVMEPEWSEFLKALEEAA